MTTPAETPAIIFREDQRFRQPILWVILIVVDSVLIGSALFIMTRDFSSEGVGGSSKLLISLFVLLPVLLTLLLFIFSKLQIEVTTSGLFVRFFPFHRKVRQIDLSDVVRVEAVQYRAVLEYGGYGIRLLPRAKAYNVGGDQGVRIQYRNGYHVLLGTQHPSELRDAIMRVMPTIVKETRDA